MRKMLFKLYSALIVGLNSKPC